MAGSIGTKFVTHVQIHLGIDIHKQIAPPDTMGALGGGFRDSTAGPIGTKFGTRLRIRLGMGIG